MDKVFIKDVPSFCRMNRIISGIVNLETELFNDSLQNEDRISLPKQIVRMQYHFQGEESFEGKFYLKGRWSADIQLKCCYCCEDMNESLEQDYPALLLIDEKDDPLSYQEDCQECRFDYFDLKPWLYSELMLALPISPKHSLCTLS